ncbi:MAG TPA: hypothetical protein VFR03_03200 [Thermoanaerobaculia bacterium]|nr:hypothetical protein [Thermoanaerobaculia bacterium]
MPMLVTGAELREGVLRQDFIKGGDPGHAEGVKYDLTLSSMILKAGSAPIDASALSQIERGQLVVQPGEVVFALTEERLELPPNMMAQLSPKRSISHAGILVIGGFCIDPGYHGHLLLGLYNLSSTPFRLLPGRRVIAATFYHLEEGETGDFPEPQSLDEFPPELIQTMEKYRPEGAQALVEAVRQLEINLQSLRSEVMKHNRFEETLERHDSQIEKLLTGLTAEADARKRGEDRLTEGMQNIEKTFDRLIGGAKVVGWIVTLILLPVLVGIIIELWGKFFH